MGFLWLWADSQDIVRGVECRRYSHCTPSPPCIERLFLLFLYLKWNTMHVHHVFTPSTINSLHVLYSTEEQVQVIQFKYNQSDKISPFEKECRMGICNLVNFDLWWQIYSYRLVYIWLFYTIYCSSWLQCADRWYTCTSLLVSISLLCRISQGILIDGLNICCLTSHREYFHRLYTKTQ